MRALLAGPALYLLLACGGGAAGEGAAGTGAGDAAAAQLEVLDGLRVERYAGPPDMGAPTAFCFDERARLFLLDTPAGDAPGGGAQAGTAGTRGATRIRICEDADGDGRADRFVTYADGLAAPSGILKAHAGILLAQAPDLLLLRDVDGDDVADERRVLLTGFGRSATDPGPSQLVWGPHNRLYGVVGAAGFDGVDADGRPRKFAQGIWSCDPDGGGLEFVAALPREACGVAWSPDLELWGATAASVGASLIGVPRTVVRPQDQDSLDAVVATSSAPAAAPPGARGLAFIESAVLPDALQGEAMLCLPGAGRVARLRVEAAGSGFRTGENGDVLRAVDGAAFTPVQAVVGHDGEIWVADAAAGCIWRLVAIGRDPIDCAGQGESALIPSGFAMRTIAQPLATAPFVKLSLGALRETAESARALLDSGRLLDADPALRRHAWVAAARMPSDHALGAALAQALLDPALADDPWLPLALRAAAIRHAAGFLPAADALLQEPSAANLTFARELTDAVAGR